MILESLNDSFLYHFTGIGSDRVAHIFKLATFSPSAGHENVQPPLIFHNLEIVHDETIIKGDGRVSFSLSIGVFRFADADLGNFQGNPPFLQYLFTLYKDFFVNARALQKIIVVNAAECCRVKVSRESAKIYCFLSASSAGDLILADG